jgi:hypothetical protein
MRVALVSGASVRRRNHRFLESPCTAPGGPTYTTTHRSSPKSPIHGVTVSEVGSGAVFGGSVVCGAMARRLERLLVAGPVGPTGPVVGNDPIDPRRR